VCGSATNAFLNLTRSAGVESRRSCWLTHSAPRNTVAEVYIDDAGSLLTQPTARLSRMLTAICFTRRNLQNPAFFARPPADPRYIPDYSYESYAHVRLAALPLHGFHIRWVLDVSSRLGTSTWTGAFCWSARFSCICFSPSTPLSFSCSCGCFSPGGDIRLRVPRFTCVEPHPRNGRIFHQSEIK